MPPISAMKAPRSACIRASLLLGPAAVWQKDWIVGAAKRSGGQLEDLLLGHLARGVLAEDHVRLGLDVVAGQHAGQARGLADELLGQGEPGALGVAGGLGRAHRAARRRRCFSSAQASRGAAR